METPEISALKPPDARGYFRFHKLGEDYTLEEIRAHPAQHPQADPLPGACASPPPALPDAGKPRQKSRPAGAVFPLLL